MFENYVGHMWFISDKTVAVKIYYCLHKNTDKKILLKNTDMIYRIKSLFSFQQYVIYVPSHSVFFVISPWWLPVIRNHSPERQDILGKWLAIFLEESNGLFTF